jgi:hypothetical protein
MLALEDSQFRLAVLGTLSVNEWQDATRLSERDPVNRPGFRRHLQVHNSRTPLELYRRQSPV